MKILLVAAGGAIGAVLRHLISIASNSTFQNLSTGTKFPAGTFIVNLAGSFLIGLLLGYTLSSDNISENMTPF